jgi:hypothetical protein
VAESRQLAFLVPVISSERYERCILIITRQQCRAHARTYDTLVAMGKHSGQRRGAATLTTKVLRTTRHLNSKGILTLETLPGLNRHFRNVRTAESSSIGFPVLCVIEAAVTFPLPGAMSTTQTPLPVM